MRRHVKAAPAQLTWDAATDAGYSRFRLFSVLLLVIAASMALLSASAFAAQSHLYTGTSIGPNGADGPAEFIGLQGLAVDQTGNVYAYDAPAGKIYKFDSAGEPVNFSALSSNVIEGLDTAAGGAENELAVAPPGSPGGTAGDIYLATGRAVKIFAPSGELLGQLTGPEPCGVAIDPAGHLFVGEYPSTIRELVPSANPVTALDQKDTSTASLPGICNVAADGLGNVYAASWGGTEVAKLEGIGDTTPTLLNGGKTLAADFSNNDIYFDRETNFLQYDSAANFIGSSTVGQLNLSHGIAVNASSGDVYVNNGHSQRIDIFGPVLTVPSATTEDATELTKSSAKINGTVNPAGTETTYQFEYGTNRNYGDEAPASPALVGTDSTDHQLSAEISGLQPESTYHYRIVASNANGTVFGEDFTFETGASGLSVETTGSPVRTATTVRFDSRIFNHSNPTSYYFEYGSQGPCDSSPCTATDPQSAGSEFGIELVSQRVEGLAPETTYHYRVVAEDGSPGSPVTGADKTVTTQGSDVPLTHGRLAGPPQSDRAWEQVNMPDTGGNPVGMLGNTSYSLFFSDSENDDRAVYPLRGGTPTTDTGSAFSLFFSKRTPSGWQVEDVKPPRSELVGGNWSPESNIVTPDLSVVASANTNLGTGDASIWKLSFDSSPEKLLENTRGQNVVFGSGLGLSADGSRVLATAEGEVDPDYPLPLAPPETPPLPQIFDVSSGGVPQLVSKLPNGHPCEPAVSRVPPASSGWVSDDGSRFFFSCGSAQGRLYVHNFETDQSKLLSGTCSEEATFLRSIPGVAFFTTSSSLTPDDTTTPGSLCGNRDVYRFDFSGEDLHCLTCVTSLPVEIPNGKAALVTPNGSRVYFVSSNALIAGAADVGIYRLDLASGNLAYIGSAAGMESTLQTNPDGSVLLFYASGSPNNAFGGQQNGGTTQAYRYDDKDRSLVCVSCPTDGSPASYAMLAPFINELPLESSDGATVAFATPTPLSPLDQNTVSPEQIAEVGADVYEWRDGRLFLVTDGVSEWSENDSEEAIPPIPVAVSPSGRDLYFTAAAQYTPDALDGYRRLYDARIGGGFEFPPPPKLCPLEVCQGTPKGAPEEQAPGTGTFAGATGTSARHRKAHKKRAQKKKQHKSAKKGHRASHDRRTAR